MAKFKKIPFVDFENFVQVYKLKIECHFPDKITHKNGTIWKLSYDCVMVDKMAKFGILS